MITNDKRATMSQFAGQRSIAYPLIADPSSTIIKAFGVASAAFPVGSKWHGIAHPSIYVIGRDGAVSHVFTDPNYQNRPSIDSILSAIKG